MEASKVVFMLLDLLGKRVEVVKSLLMDAITECRSRAPSLLLLDDLDTLCHLPQDIASNSEQNYLSRYSLFDQLI